MVPLYLGATHPFRQENAGLGTNPPPPPYLGKSAQFGFFNQT